MRIDARTLGRDALVSGLLAGLATAAVAALVARAHGKPPAAPINAVSHVLWPQQAAEQDRVSLRYTLTGFAINLAAATFWAVLDEALGSLLARGRAAPAKRLASSVLTSAAAYVTDYHVVPRRLTPGYELRLPQRTLGWIYAALALSLPLRALLARGRR